MNINREGFGTVVFFAHETGVAHGIHFGEIVGGVILVLMLAGMFVLSRRRKW